MAGTKLPTAPPPEEEPSVVFEDLLGGLQREYVRLSRRCEGLNCENMHLRSCLLKQGNNLDIGENKAHHKDPLEKQSPDLCAPGADRWYCDLPKENPLPQTMSLQMPECTSPCKPCDVDHKMQNAPPRAPRDVDEQAVVLAAEKQQLATEMGSALAAVRIEPTGSNARMASTGSNARITPTGSKNRNMSARTNEVLRQMIEIFEELDADGSGTLSNDELRIALEAAGVPQSRLIKLIRIADADNSGAIDLNEWKNAVTTGSASEICYMAQKLAQKKKYARYII